MNGTPTRSLAEEYSAKASVYESHWSPVIKPMAVPIFSALPMATARTVVDAGAGTGAMVSEIKAVAPHALITAIDPAEGMLRIARRNAGLVNAVVAKAEQLPIRRQSIDVGLLIFVLFHLPDPVEGLREMHRVLRDDGRAGIVCWGNDPGVPGASIWTEELNREAASPDPRDASVMQASLMNTTVKLTDLVESSGCSVHEIWAESFSHQFKLDDMLQLQLGCAVAARRLPSLDGEARARCIQRVRDRLEKFSDDELNYRPEVLFAVIS